METTSVLTSASRGKPNKPEAKASLDSTGQAEAVSNLTSSSPQKEEPATPDIETTVADLNQRVQNSQRSIEFSVHEDIGRTVITIRDKETGDEIRTIPSEDFLKIASYLKEVLEQAGEVKPGLLVSSQV